MQEYFPSRKRYANGHDTPDQDCFDSLPCPAFVVLTTAGVLLIFGSISSSVADRFIPQDEPIVQSQQGLRCFATGERATLLDFLSAEVRRARRHAVRGAEDAILCTASSESRRRKALKLGPGSPHDVVESQQNVRDVLNLPKEYWSQDGEAFGAPLGVSRSVLTSRLMDRILVVPSHRILYCPISGVASRTITALLSANQKSTDFTGTYRLSELSLRDRERFLLSTTVHRFLFVRHPFARAVAAYNRGISSGPVDSPDYRAFMGLVRGRALSEHEHELQKVSFLFFLTFLARQNAADLDEQFIPQSLACGTGSIDYDFTGRLETFDEDIQALCEKTGLNKDLIGPSPPTSNASAEARELFSSLKHRTKAVKLYGVDLDAFGYAASVESTTL